MTDSSPVMVITGTSRGIGRGMVEHFVGKGYQVAGCSRGPSTLEIDGYRHSQIEVADEAQVRGWIHSVKKSYGHIDVLVCNAARIPAPTLLPLTSGSVLERVLKTNIIGSYYVCREAAKVMMLQRSGRIIAMSSIAASLHAEGTSLYASSKSAVAEMIKILAKELAPFGITCNVIAPSITTTSATEELGESFIARTLEKVTIKRMLTADEICNVISFFASPLSSCITGQILYMGLVN